MGVLENVERAQRHFLVFGGPLKDRNRQKRVKWYYTKFKQKFVSKFLTRTEVIRLQLDDLDWSNGQLIVRASKRRERLLPLTQEVADALLEYLQHSRPTTTYREIFLWHTAPFVPLQCASAITYVVQCLLKKAGIKRETSGAHLLRHTVASHMVNNGVSFKDTADFLGHRFLQTTSIYAKLDLAALSEVAMPWPGGAQ